MAGRVRVGASDLAMIIGAGVAAANLVVKAINLSPGDISMFVSGLVVLTAVLISKKKTCVRCLDRLRWI